MTSFLYRFDKVLNLREQERDETEMAYKEAIEEFEKIATQLYDQMKKKKYLGRTATTNDYRFFH